MDFADGWRGLLRSTLVLLLACLGFLTGCATSPPPRPWAEQQSTALCRRITRLSKYVDRKEAESLAETAVQYPILLAQQYRAVRPSWVHNMFVNAGIRERGLCYHWANDLFARLSETPRHSLELHLAVAHMDTRREHNAIVVTAHGQPVSEGLVLDAWRHPGRLWWGTAADDKYPWKPLPRERVNPDLQKFVAR
jgi:hypothetical protein